MTTTLQVRRDEVKPGDVLHSSHGYKLLVVTVEDGAEVRTDDRHVGISGVLAHNTSVERSERYAAGSKVTVERPNKPLMVKVTMTLPIDPEGWTMTYGVEGTKETRFDVKAYVENTVWETLRENGVLVEPKFSPRCKNCGAQIEHEKRVGWVDVVSGDLGGTYDRCPAMGAYGHVPFVY